MGKRVLVCAPRMPEYDREGGSRRVFHLIEFLRGAGWSVTFVAQYADGSARYTRMLQQRGVITYAGEDSSLVEDEYLPDITELLVAGCFDVAILVFWENAEKYIPLIREHSPKTRIIVDSIDLHFLRIARQRIRKDATAARSQLLDRRYADEFMRELNSYAQADAVLTVSDREAAILGDYLNASVPIYPVPLMEDMAPSVLRAHERKGIVFVANYRHPPNIEALEFFCDEVLPLLAPTILERHPVLVVGNDADKMASRIKPERRPAIRLIGWVPSVEPYIQQARVSVVPLLHGAGTKTKLIQALTIGTPCVSTTIGIEGLDVHDGQDTLVADTPVNFAIAIARLIEDDALWQRLREHGMAAIAQRHGPEAVRAAIFGMLDDVLRLAPL